MDVSLVLIVRPDGHKEGGLFDFEIIQKTLNTRF